MAKNTDLICACGRTHKKFGGRTNNKGEFTCEVCLGVPQQTEAKRLAEEHYNWLETWIHLIYVDAFVHGYGHGYEDAEKET